MAYSSLHNHSYYSIQDGFSSPKEYMDVAQKIGIKAIALTEHGCFYSAPYMHKLKKDYPDIKVIYGVEAYEAFDVDVRDANNKYFHLVLLAKNDKGRIAINKLITESEFRGKYNKPRMDLKMIAPYADDLICTSACLASKLSREENYEKCIEYINEYKEIFKHFYLEMQSHDTISQNEYNNKVLKLSFDTGVPYIITTDSHYATKEQMEYQGIFVQIARDSDTLGETYSGCYIQTEEEIHEIMDKQIGYDNVCIGLENTNVIADLCEDVQMPFQDPKLPTFPIPDGKTQKQYILELCNEGWKNRGFKQLPEEERRIRRERLFEELNTIDRMGFIGYFLIVYDFIRWGRSHGVLFGDGGRGSGAGSIVNYLLGITGIDPVKYGLIFSRFLNEERVGLPKHIGYYWAV